MKLNQLPNHTQYNPVGGLNKAPQQGPNTPPEVPQDKIERSQSNEESGLAEKLRGLKVLGRPALAGALGLAAGAGITALAAGSSLAAAPWLAPAILVGGALGIATGVIGMPKEYGMFAGLGKTFSGIINGSIGATAAFVGKAAVLGAGAGAGVGVAATVGASVIGLAALGWGAAKLSEAIRPRF